MPATASSAPAADRLPLAGRLAEPLALSILVGAMAAVMFATHRAGHWWGDDWALYLRQADGLVSGDPGRALRENRVAVDLSSGPAFSPALYPWGFPLVLAPFVAMWGTDVDRLAAVQVLAASSFAVAWYLLARRRLGVVPALVGVVAATLTPVLLGWTELIQSEWTFLAVAAAALVMLDRLVASDRLLTPTASFWPLAGLGIWAAAAFSVRREGAAVIVAIAVAQAWGWWTVRGRAPVRDLVARAATLHLTALVAVVVLQLVLPTTVVPRYRGTSPWNMWRYRSDHARHLLEIAGLKRPWDADPTVLQNESVGWVVGGAFLLIGMIGVGWAAGRRADVHLAAFAVAAFVIGGSFRVPLNRYVASVAPMLLLLGLQAVAVAARGTGIRRLPVATTTAVALAIAAGNVANAHLRIDEAREYESTGRVEWGPTHPDALEMFAEVRARTGPDDVVGAPKARAMTFATGRLAVQVDEYRPVPGDVTLALVVTDLAGPVDVELNADRSWQRVWSNARFVIYRLR